MPDSSADALLKRAHSLKDEAETKALYRDWAASYDKTMLEGLGYLSPLKGAKLLSENVKDKTSRILDIGTGTGLVGKELAALGFNNIDGMDYSEPMLEVARKTGVYGELFVTDLNKPLSLDDSSFDVMICIGTFTQGHVGANCLDELFRVLKPGGRFVTAIRKNYWQPAGFAAKIEAMSEAGIIRTISSKEDSNYTNSKEAESWFIVWEKC